MKKTPEQIALEAAAWVVDAFDQADTSEAIRVHNTFSTTNRKQILVVAIDSLRASLAKTATKPTFTTVKDGRPEL